jgi:hypothetical protein
MGRAKHVLATGKVGNIIFYEYRGQMCCRSAPGSIRQTKGMKKSASRFGLAAQTSSYIRSAIGRIFHDANDKAMLYGFNTAINKWLREYDVTENTSSVSNFYIDNFQFNATAPMSMLVKKPVSARFTGTGAITVNVPELIPGIDIIAPAGTVQIHYNACVTGCTLCFRTNSCMLVNPVRRDKRAASIVLEYGVQSLPQQNLSLHIQLEKSALVVVVFSIQYEVQRGDVLEMVTDKSWWPVSVVGSCFGSSK